MIVGLYFIVVMTFVHVSVVIVGLPQSTIYLLYKAEMTSVRLSVCPSV